MSEQRHSFTRAELTDALTRIELRVKVRLGEPGKIAAEEMADAIIRALDLGGEGGTAA